MTTDEAIADIKQRLRGMVSELNRRDQADVALLAQQALAATAALADQVDAWDLGDVAFTPVTSDDELIQLSARKGPRRAS